MSWLIRRPGRNWEVQWRNSVTGKIESQTTGTAIKREAERFQVRLDDEMAAGKRKKIVKKPWDEMLKAYKKEWFVGMSDDGQKSINESLGLFELYVEPEHPREIGDAEVEKFHDGLLGRNIAASTIFRHLSELKRLLEWAVGKRYVAAMPEITLPDFPDAPKGRAPKFEEFERILSKIPEVPRAKNPASWDFMCRGYWWGGLRLDEGCALHWTDDSELCVDFDNARPVFRISVQLDKGRENRVFPIAPEFAAMLQDVPKRRRHGYVFNPEAEDTERPTPNIVSRTISLFGKAALVKVGSREQRLLKNGELSDPVKWASAHDFRRAFCERWSWRVVPRVLQVMARHKSIATTQKFYLGKDTQEMAEQVWKAFDGLQAQDGRTMSSALGQLHDIGRFQG